MKRIHFFLCLTVLCFIMLFVSYAYFNFKNHTDAMLKTMVLLSISKNVDLIRNTLSFAKSFHSSNISQSNATQTISQLLNNSTAVSPRLKLQLTNTNQSKLSIKVPVQQTNGALPTSSSVKIEKELKKMTFQDKIKKFDWKFYVKINPDLAPNGITTEKMAIEHYTNYGFLEQRWSNPHEMPSKVACHHAKNMVPPPAEYLAVCIKHYT